MEAARRRCGSRWVQRGLTHTHAHTHTYIFSIRPLEANHLLCVLTMCAQVLRTKPEDLKKADDSKADDSKADDSKAKEP